MATGITKSSTVSAIVDSIIAEARYTMVHKTVMLPHVRHYTLPKGVSTISVPKFGTITVASLTEGVDMAAPQTLSPSESVSLTASEVGCQVILTDMSIKYSGEDIHRTTGRLQGEAMAKKVDQDLLTLFSSFTTHSLGSSSTDMAPGLISAGYFRLKGGTEPAPDPYALVIHPYAAKHLVDQITQILAITSERTFHGNMAQGLPQNVFTAGFMGVDKLFGIPVYLSGNITITTACINGLFSKEAICFVDDANAVPEKERDASLRAWEINYVQRYGTGMYQESYGCLITTDSTIPTT